MDPTRLRALLGTLMVTVALTFHAPPAVADPIPIPAGATPEQDLLVTYYVMYTGPFMPPFGSVYIVMCFNGWGADELMTFDFFDGQQGEGTFFSQESYGPSSHSFTFNFDSTKPTLLDGQFSIGFRLATGSAELIGSSVTVGNGDGAFYTVDGVVTPRGSGYIVPEPATMALVGIGLAGIAFSRRRRA